MIMNFLGISHSEVTHILLAALYTNFKIGVAVDFAEFFWGNSTLSMKAINILANDMLQMFLFH